MRRFLLGVALLALPAFARERAVVIYPREHALFRPLFYTLHQRLLLDTLRTHYDVDVHEQVGTARDFFSIDVKGASLLIISGHGNPFAISLSGREERTIDASERERLIAFFSSLAPDATIVLQSCDTGRGFASLIKETAGQRHVIAAHGTIPRDGLHIESLEPFSASITCADAGREYDCTVRL